MADNVKTAVSLHRELLERGEAVAKQMHVSRSRLFALALEEFVRRHENRQLVDRLNAAYSDGPDLSEQTLRKKVRRHHRRLLEGEW